MLIGVPLHQSPDFLDGHPELLCEVSIRCQKRPSWDNQTRPFRIFRVGKKEEFDEEEQRLLFPLRLDVQHSSWDDNCIELDVGSCNHNLADL